MGCKICGQDIDPVYQYQIEDMPLCPACYCDAIDEGFEQQRPGVKLAAMVVLSAMLMAVVVTAGVMVIFSR